MTDFITETQNQYSAARWAVRYYWHEICKARRTGNTWTDRYRVALAEHQWWKTECKRLEALMEVRR